MIDKLPPEVQRRWASDCGSVRLMVGGTTIAFLCMCLYFVCSLNAKPAQTAIPALVGLQAALLIGYGGSLISKSITEEKKQGTWDLQRLTPLNSAELALGKLLGAPLFPAFLAAVACPWAIYALFSLAHLSVIDVVKIYAFLLSATALFWCGCLVMSSYAEGTESMRGFFWIPIAVLFVIPMLDDRRFHGLPRMDGIEYCGWKIPYVFFACASALAFAAWAFESARARIALDKLEPMISWRLPAFSFFLYFYLLGFGREHARLSVIPIAAFIAAAVLGETWGAAEWKTWLSYEPMKRILSASCLISGMAACFILSIASVLIATPSGLHSPSDSHRIGLLLSLFLSRDLMFLQWCRLRTTRRPEMLALIYVALAYFLPSLIFAALGIKGAVYFYAPIPQEEVSFAANALPGLVQALIIAGLLLKNLSRLRPRRSGAVHA